MLYSTITKNAVKDSSVIVEKVLISPFEIGCDAQRDEFVDMIVQSALQDASSVASLLTTAEAVVVEAPKPEKNAASVIGGMGGSMEEMSFERINK